MTTVAPSNSNRTPYKSYSDIGNSRDYLRVNDRFLEARKHYEAKPSLENSILAYIGDSDSSYTFKTKIDKVCNLLVKNLPIFSNKDLEFFPKLIEKLDLLTLSFILRLVGPMLENRHYFDVGADITRRLLKDKRPEVRYTALEAISSALGTSPIADKLLYEAQELLINEEKVYIHRYLAHLLSSNANS